MYIISNLYSVLLWKHNFDFYKQNVSETKGMLKFFALGLVKNIFGRGEEEYSTFDS